MLPSQYPDCWAPTGSTVGAYEGANARERLVSGRRGTGGPAAAELRPSLSKADHSALLGLMVVRHFPAQSASVDPAFKAAVLTDALRTSRTFDTWGIPHLYWEQSARALIETGDAAVEPLEGLLLDTRPAPVWGCQEAAQYAQYRYRVCDYAWALLNEVRGRKVVISKVPEDRDRLIAALLGKKGK